MSCTDKEKNDMTRQQLNLCCVCVCVCVCVGQRRSLRRHVR